MKLLRFGFAISITIIFFFFLNFKQGDVPPLGSFLSPFTGFWQNGEAEELNIASRLETENLSEQVLIKFDTELIPHIFAKNEYDLYFAQGYVTAMHRLWQMEFQVLAAEGRLSEIIGKATLDLDRTSRRKGLKYGAERSLAIVKKDPQILNMVQAYTDGVNHWIDKLSYKDFPVEYKLLDYEPEKWTNLKAMLLMKNMADMLSRGENDLENTNALALFGDEDFRTLFPETYKNIDPVIPNSKKWNFDPIQIERPDIEFPQDFTKDVIEKPDPRNGSNNFVVSGAKTANGRVLLANEPDLSLNLPSIWYVTQLHAPSINAYGVTLPGAPGLIIGFNDSIAWGLTNAKRDVVDWYKVEFKNADRTEYRYDDKWLKSEKIVETFKIKGEDEVYDTIVHTHYGPVVYDYNFMGNGEETNLAMKWTAHEGSQELKTLYEVNRAKNYDEFIKSFKYYTGPPQNFAFACANGDIGITVQGKFPVKWQDQGKFLMDGRDSKQEWQAIIPYEQNASVLNPERGFVSSANQHPVDSTYPYYVYDYNYEFYRNRRINDRLALMSNIKVEDMIRLQNDNYNYRAYESLPLMLDSLDTTSLSIKEERAFELLRKWDYFMEPDWLAPTIYQKWWDIYYSLVWDEFDGKNIALSKPHVYNTIYLSINDPYNKYFDIESTSQIESAHDLINQSFKLAIEKLEAWKKENDSDYFWYMYKNTRVNHLLRLEPFSVDHVKIGGYNNVVNAASGRHGPSWRMVVELGGEKTRAWGVYPGSQTGNPGNPGYAHMIENWATGEYYPLLFLEHADQQHEKIIFTQTIDPSQK